jgi:hypothetical protein
MGSNNFPKSARVEKADGGFIVNTDGNKAHVCKNLKECLKIIEKCMNEPEESNEDSDINEAMPGMGIVKVIRINKSIPEAIKAGEKSKEDNSSIADKVKESLSKNKEKKSKK